MQKEILLFFLSISSPLLDAVANIGSFFGEQSILIILLAWILYTDDKHKAYAVSGPILTASLSMSLIKAIVKAPRPFQVLDEIDGKRLTTATGYSFPSGHTTIASSMYFAIARAYKNKKVTVICTVLVVWVALSRMYLGVHWPIDVLVGLSIGLACTLFLYPVFYNISKNPEKKYKVSWILSTVFFACAIPLTVLLQLKMVDEVAYADFLKTLSIAAGAYFGFARECKKLNYKTDGTVLKKALRIVLSAAFSLAIIASLKQAFGVKQYYTGCLVRYSLVGMFLTYYFPLLFRNLFEN
ncbi:MAG: phosphatase PAP2 family protein [Sphaerochaetaceae bacterium]|nr:phosphatase PAP2 family protein [Sphaerochaetaceae bacterium]